MKYTRRIIANYRGFNIWYDPGNDYFYTDGVPFECFKDAKQHIEWVTLPEDLEIYELNKDIICYN